MSRWFRMYDEALDDPKVQSMPPEDFRGWVNILCLASRNEGKLPSIEGIAFGLRISNIAAGSLVDRLTIAGLIDVRKGGANGSYIAPHSWEKRQYKSDGSTDRVKRFRERSKPVTETAPDTDTDTELPLPNGSGAAPPDLDENARFWANSKSFLVRQGKSQSEAGKLIGKWIKASTRDNVAKILGAAQANPPSDIVAYIEGAIRNGKSNGGEFWTISGDPHSGIPL